MKKAADLEQVLRALKSLTYIIIGMEILGAVLLITGFVLSGGEFTEYVCTSNCGTLWENGTVQTKSELSMVIVGIIALIFPLISSFPFNKYLLRIKACNEEVKSAKGENYQDNDRLTRILDEMQKMNLTHLIEYSEIQKRKQIVTENTNSKSNKIDKFDQLTKLGELKEKGFITQEEYNLEKIKILNQ